MTNLVLGAVLAGLVFFVWSAISWMLLPWQRRTFREFRDEGAVARVIAEQAPESGIYGLPGEPKYPAGASPEQRQAIDQAAWDTLQRGPSVLAVVKHGGMATFPRMLAIALFFDIVVALLVGWMLSETVALGYWQRALFVVVFSVAAGLACRIPDWNWHQFPLRHTIVNIATLVVGSALAGLVLAAFVQGRTTS